MSIDKIEGGCFCGNIRYAVDKGEYTVVNCHCTMCRKTNAAPYVTWIVVPDDKFQITQGVPTILQSSANGTRHFCNQCGTAVSCENTGHPGIVDVTLGSLDDPTCMRPTLEIHPGNRLDWVQDLSHLKDLTE